MLSSKECACCACDPSVHLSVPSIGFVYFVCRKLSPRLTLSGLRVLGSLKNVNNPSTHKYV